MAMSSHGPFTPLVATLLAAGCASNAPTNGRTASPPTVSIVERSDGAPRCPPTPPPPRSTQACGNGTAEDVYELISASCIPGRCCSSGWVPSTASEECDGSDLRGQSCRTLGFVRGALKCTAGCKLDASGCARAAAAQAKVEVVAGGPQCGSGHLPALALRGTLLGLAYPNGTALAFTGYDTSAGLARVAGGTLLVGGGYRQDALAEWHSPQGPRTTTGSVVMAAVGDGFLAAAQRYGDDTSTAVVRIRPDGRIEGPIATVRGRPLFLVPGGDGALLGFEGSDVGLQILGADGAVKGSPLSPFGRAKIAYGQLQASAQPTDDGWIVAAGSLGPPLPIEVVSVSATGVTSPITRLSEGGTAVLLTRGPLAQAVFIQGNALLAADARTGQHARTISRDGPLQLLAAEGAPDGLIVWVESKVVPSGTGLVARIVAGDSGVPTIEDVVSVPLTRPCASTLHEGTLLLWLSDENGRTAPALFRGR